MLKTFANTAGKAFLVLAASVLCVLALPGCSGGTNEAAAPSSPAAGTVVSKAMVVYNNGGSVLFADQDNDTLYYPTLVDATIIGLDGDDIDADELAVGNIVQVSGNGIMLESYPGQYPGITEVAVIEQGNPADADKYAEELALVAADPDPAEVPSGYVEYTTDLAQTSVMLEPFDYDWVVPGDGNANSTTQELDGEYDDAQGVLNANVADARISSSLQAAVGFSVAPLNVTIERTPLTTASADSAAVNPNAEDEPVPCTQQADGTTTFTMEPGFLYEVDAEFTQGEASYAFYTFS